MDNNKKQEFCFLLIIWLLFSVLYWIGATYKDIHGHEFYSWVYAERCSFTEILTLKDTGIGHPPLFHLLQKVNQAVNPFSPKIALRTLNFIFGSIFVLILAQYLKRKKQPIYFIYALVLSSGILNLFIFSRMWGFLSLISLILIIKGEEYSKSGCKKFLLQMILLFIVGIYTDYNFILILPYIVLLFLSKFRIYKGSVIFFMVLSLILWFFSTYFGKSTSNTPFYTLITSMPLLIQESVNSILNFWFFETYFIALFVLLFIQVKNMYFHHKNNTTEQNIDINFSQKLILGTILITILSLIFKSDIISAKYLAISILVVLIYLGKQVLTVLKIRRESNYQRIFFSIFFAFFILLIISPLFWTDLNQVRFIYILMPLFFILTIDSFSEQLKKAITVILLLSSFIFIFSKGVQNRYTPPVVDSNIEDVVFHDIIAYVSTYFKDPFADNSLFIIDPLHFTTSCRVCKMGTTNIPFSKFNTFRLIAESDSDCPDSILIDFELTHKKAVNLSYLDKLQFKLFTPIYKKYYSEYNFSRLNFIKKN